MVGRALQMASRLMVARGAGARAGGRLWVCPPLRRLPGLLGRARSPGPAPRARAGAAGPSQPPGTRSRGSPSPARPTPAAAFWSPSGLSRGPGSSWAAATRRGGASSPDLALLGAPAARARRSELLPPRTSRATSAADTEAGKLLEDVLQQNMGLNQRERHGIWKTGSREKEGRFQREKEERR
ncbi:intraflagellar transport protein 74-like isoform X5 [Felis catus]|uniref:intraflagellar transport protein 74-like isoform X5 n=1 Tax=Felis catus TaxID=9685 RepID=UPI000C2FF1AD|nr:intraflagellar transport protein 74-like isoform X5 [Felis catus]